MAIHIGFDNSISIVALLLSVFSTVMTIKFNRRRDKLNQLLIAKEQQQISELGEADISAEFTKLEKYRCRLRVSNKGKATAANVRMEIPGGLEYLRVLNLDMFPMPTLEPGQNVFLPAMKGSNSPAQLTIKFTWDDPSGKNRQKTRTIST
jgi:hypothetical protein